MLFNINPIHTMSSYYTMSEIFLLNRNMDRVVPYFEGSVLLYSIPTFF